MFHWSQKNALAEKRYIAEMCTWYLVATGPGLCVVWPDPLKREKDAVWTQSRQTVQKKKFDRSVDFVSRLFTQRSVVWWNYNMCWRFATAVGAEDLMRRRITNSIALKTGKFMLCRRCCNATVGCILHTARVWNMYDKVVLMLGSARYNLGCIRWQFVIKGCSQIVLDMLWTLRP